MELCESGLALHTSRAVANGKDVLEELLPPLRVDCVSLSCQRRRKIALPCMVVETDGTAITGAAVDALMAFSQRVLELAQPFCVLWDLRRCSVPPAGPIWRCLNWGIRNKTAIDTHVRCKGILLSSGVMRSVVNSVLAVAQPPMPRIICSSDEEFWDFAMATLPKNLEKPGRVSACLAERDFESSTSASRSSSFATVRSEDSLPGLASSA